MRVCYFGTYEKDYPRNRIIIKGLRKKGIEVIECHYPLWERQEDKTGKYLSFFSLLKIMLRLLWGYIVLIGKFVRTGKFDYLMVGYIGQADVFAARFLLLFKKRPLIFNPLISIYDTLVTDRQLFSQRSVLSRILFYIEKWAFQLSDTIILDTNENIKYLSKLFGIKQNKFVKIPVGADEDIFYPRKENTKEDHLFRVLFYGKFIPLHGIHHILHAAKALEDDPEIRFRIIGRGQLSSEIHSLAEKLHLPNVEFIDWVPYEELPEYISQANLCLGIFGDTEKAKRVIPNKVFQVLACDKLVLTAATPAVSELGERANLMLCPSPYPKHLPRFILEVKHGRHRKGIHGAGTGDFLEKSALETVFRRVAKHRG